MSGTKHTHLSVAKYRVGGIPHAGTQRDTRRAMDAKDRSNRSRLIVVANRLPVTVAEADGAPTLRLSDGGLVSALAPVLRSRPGYWIGWCGCASNPEIEHLIRQDTSTGLTLLPVGLSSAQIHSFYEGYSNQSIWPLFHELQVPSRFDSEQWYSNVEVNDLFAEQCASIVRRDDFVWVNDYHLMLQAEALQERGVRARIGYFHHIPFPAPDMFDRLPWRRELLRALMLFHVIGFQTDRDRRNFVACLKRHFRDFSLRRVGSRHLVEAAGLYTTVGTFPIGIDASAISTIAADMEVQRRAEMIRASHEGCKILLGVDRLDYTKGIVERCLAFEELLYRRPEWIGRAVLLQLTVPSRETITGYAALKSEIERHVSRINGRFGRTEWMPIRYMYRAVDRKELVAMYLSADAALVTPLRDGMNLVAKEYCAARSDSRGVLVLSEFAGGAAQLGDAALLVNPFDPESLATVLDTALRLDGHEQESRMVRLRRVVSERDVFYWSRSFCAAGARVQLRTFASTQGFVAASAA